jgi:hypothetical protein
MTRERLPNHWHHEPFAFEHAGIHYTAGTGRFGVHCDVIQRAVTRNRDGTASGPLGAALPGWSA